MNISIQTVFSHRKNITRKTGIKSVSGLTVYALLKDLISEDDLIQSVYVTFEIRPSGCGFFYLCIEFIPKENMKYYIVDAFTDTPFGGNPAGVVLLDGKNYPDESLMLKVAAEFRYSETAFVRQDGRDEFTIRYFTPCTEVELCGHATIASFSVLKSMGMPDGQYLCHTKAGALTITIGDQVMMQMAKPRIVGTLSEEDSKAVYRAVGAQATTLRPQIVYSGLPDIMLPIATFADLQALQPNMEAVTAVTRRLEVVSIHAFVDNGDGYTAHVRDFAPLYGVPEESATGTANAALAYYLSQNNLIAPKAECRFLQGEAMGRPSIVAVRIDPDGSIYVGGTAAIVAEGQLLVP